MDLTFACGTWRARVQAAQREPRGGAQTSSSSVSWLERWLMMCVCKAFHFVAESSGFLLRRQKNVAIFAPTPASRPLPQINQLQSFLLQHCSIACVACLCVILFAGEQCKAHRTLRRASLEKSVSFSESDVISKFCRSAEKFQIDPASPFLHFPSKVRVAEARPTTAQPCR